MALRVGSVWLALCAMLIGTASAWALAPHDKAVGVQPKHRADNAINAQQNASSEPQKAPEISAVIPEVHPSGSNGEGQPKAQESADEGTEFWTPLRGYRFKITDSIIAVFTVLLFLATVALWWATRRLVRGADRTAICQLRAYVGIDKGNLLSDGGAKPFQAELKVKNFGQTPAREVRRTIACVHSASGERPPRNNINPKTVQSIMLMPGSEVRLNYPAWDSNTVEVTDAARAGRTVWLVGTIFYRDAFGKKRKTQVSMFARLGFNSLVPDRIGNDAT